MIDIRPYTREDLLTIDPQDTQIMDIADMSDELATALESPWAWTLSTEGVILSCMGLQKVWEGRAVAWCVFSRHVKPQHFFGFRTGARNFIDAALNRAGYRRIEASVMVDFPDAVRWVKLLGFHEECVMRNYSPRGDAYLVARVE